MALTDAEADRLAIKVLDASSTRRAIAPISADKPGFDVADGYAVARHVVRRRTARGERPVGWKIGFTNRTIWDEYAVHTPIWGPMYNSTVAPLDPGKTEVCPVANLMEPRIEAEIYLRVARQPTPGMSEAELLDCVDAVGHGFEIVQSVYPSWQFRAADTVAAFALHGLYRHGPPVILGQGANRAEWLRNLGAFTIQLDRDGQAVDTGVAANVLGGPLSALRHFVDGLAAMPFERAIQPGDLVTTGTVTRAFPISPGERWHSHVSGLPLPGLQIEFT